MKQTTTIAIGVICVVCAAMMMSGCLGTYDSKHGSSDSGSVSGSAVILSHEMSLNEFGRTQVTGVVKNTGKTILVNGDVRVTFYDVNGVVISEGDSYAGQIWPGETNDFTHWFKDENHYRAKTYAVELVHERYDTYD